MTQASATEPSAALRPLDHLAERGCELGLGARPALILPSATLTHEGLRARVALLAGWLESLDLGTGARIASWAAKGEISCLLPLAAARAGLIHVPINPMLKRAQVAYILADSEAALLIATPARLESLEPGDLPQSCHALSEKEALTAAADANETLGPSEADDDDLAAILYTSGSTGRPKGVMLSHANLWLGAVSVAHYLGLESDDVTLAVLPLAFDYGQNQLLSTWFAGGAIVPLDFLLPRDVAKAVERHGVTTLAGVPPLWRQLTGFEWPASASDTIKRCTNSGGALTPDLAARLQATFPKADIFAMYGLTEAFRSTYLAPKLLAQKPGSMGKAVLFAEVLVIGDDGEVAPDSEEGELVHCGPLVARGYWRDKARTAERFRPAPAASQYGGLAVWSGDRVRRDAEGFLYFAGRRDAMIKSAGNRISPSDIEEAALASGLIGDAAAFGFADEKLGEAIALFAAPAIADEDKQLLSNHLKRELPTFMQPRTIVWKEAMPTNPNGKIDRAALAAELARRVAKEPLS